MRTFRRDWAYYAISSIHALLYIIPLVFFVQFLAIGEGRSLGQTPFESWLAIFFKDNGLHFELSRYQIPVNWIAYHFVPIMLFTHAFWKDHSSNGVYLITQIESRVVYFLSALFSGMMLCLLYQVIVIGLMLPPSLLIGGAEWTQGWGSCLRIHGFIAVENMILLMAWNLCALYFGYRAGMISTLIWLGVTTLVPWQGMLGSGSLVMRQDFITPEGFDLTGNLIVVAIYAVVLFGLYLRRAQTYDFFSEVKS